jgi:hypothetical protein
MRHHGVDGLSCGCFLGHVTFILLVKQDFAGGQKDNTVDNHFVGPVITDFAIEHDLVDKANNDIDILLQAFSL